MKVLELCSGIGNISRSFRNKGHKAISIDIDPQFNSSLVIDIRHHDLDKLFNKGYFDIIWCAPECNSYTCMTMGRNWENSLRPKTLKACYGSALLVNCLEIIEYFEPKIWMIENPRAMMRNHIGGIINTTTQCQYGKRFQKFTDVFSNKELKLLPPCKNGMKCHVHAPRGSSVGTQGNDRIETASYPIKFADHIVELCEEIAINEGWFYK